MNSGNAPFKTPEYPLGFSILHSTNEISPLFIATNSAAFSFHSPTFGFLPSTYATKSASFTLSIALFSHHKLILSPLICDSCNHSNSGTFFIAITLILAASPPSQETSLDMTSLSSSIHGRNCSFSHSVIFVKVNCTSILHSVSWQKKTFTVDVFCCSIKEKF
jgi:hypothetical protein